MNKQNALLKLISNCSGIVITKYDSLRTIIDNMSQLINCKWEKAK